MMSDDLAGIGVVKRGCRQRGEGKLIVHKGIFSKRHGRRVNTLGVGAGRKSLPPYVVQVCFWIFCWCLQPPPTKSPKTENRLLVGPCTIGFWRLIAKKKTFFWLGGVACGQTLRACLLATFCRSKIWAFCVCLASALSRASVTCLQAASQNSKNWTLESVATQIDRAFHSSFKYWWLLQGVNKSISNVRCDRVFSVDCCVLFVAGCPRRPWSVVLS